MFNEIENFKIATETEVIFKEAVALANKLGVCSLLANGCFYKYLVCGNGRLFGLCDDYQLFVNHPFKRVTLGELRNMLPVDYKQKEYLQKLEDGTYKLVVMSDVVDGHDGLIEVPEGADTYIYLTGGIGSGSFYRKDFKEVFGCYNKCWLSTTYTPENIAIWEKCKVLWKREEPVKAHAQSSGMVDPIVRDYDDCGMVGKKADFIIVDDPALGAFDTQVGGNHYKDLAIQPMRYALENKLDYAQANVVKYVTRHKLKGGKEDLLKAKHNIDLMIEFYYGDEN